jgi:tRNA(Ile)-lysidine synthase
MNYPFICFPIQITHPGIYNYSHYQIDVKHDFPAGDFPLVIRANSNNLILGINHDW